MELGKILHDLSSIFEGRRVGEGTIGIIEEILIQTEGSLDKKAPDITSLPESRYYGGGTINVIPSSRKGPCHPELLVLCFDKDNLNERMREMLYSAGIICSGKNKLVIFITTKFDHRTFEKHMDALIILKNANVEFCFIHLTRIGATEFSVI